MVLVLKPDEFLEAFPNLLASEKLFVIVSATKHGEDPHLTVTPEIAGRYWCGDCEKGVPFVFARISQIEGAKCVETRVPRHEFSRWKENDTPHVFRGHSVLRVGALPTMIFFSNGEEKGRLVEEDCYDAEKVDAFFASFAQ